MSHQQLLEQALNHAVRFLDGLDARHVAPRADVEELRAALALPLPEAGVDPAVVPDQSPADFAEENDGTACDAEFQPCLTIAAS